MKYTVFYKGSILEIIEQMTGNQANIEMISWQENIFVFFEITSTATVYMHFVSHVLIDIDLMSTEKKFLSCMKQTCHTRLS